LDFSEFMEGSGTDPGEADGSGTLCCSDLFEDSGTDPGEADGSGTLCCSDVFEGSGTDPGEADLYTLHLLRVISGALSMFLF
jgi:hypothetical protein